MAAPAALDPEDTMHQNHPAPISGLLERGFETTTSLLASVPADGWDRPSPCADWTVRQVGNHLAGGLTLLARVANGEPVAPEEHDPRLTSGTDHLGSDPAASFAAVAERCLAAFGAPGALERIVSFAAGPVPAAVLADVCLLESLVHGWDIASGAQVSFKPEDAVLDAVTAFSQRAIGAENRANGQFGPALTAAPADPPLTSLLAHLGRQA
ncbi:TIGR03086 family protein [Acrocarpospora corrugata]|uniref:TIGR03086 family protein n=1 Tax=Acrocarpospora corrugata TaxID=35763 RepID=A0A5M3VXT2_9ACTN|nr:TIGR03086 family metal-binding protein [Acrocarpospora corrugata]GES01264.1 TIGR03086 family protein [Acrocarpospora corrugata]